jgi:hypothetical protein
MGGCKPWIVGLALAATWLGTLVSVAVCGPKFCKWYSRRRYYADRRKAARR